MPDEAEELQDRLDLMPDWQLREEIATLKLLAKRIDMELKPRVHEWEARPDHEQGSGEDIHDRHGRKLGVITVGRDSPDRLEVADPVAYGGWLASRQVTMLGGMPAAVQRWIPESEATAQDFLKHLVRNSGGELPPGVVVKRGRAATVTVRFERGVVAEAWTWQGLADAVRLIMPPQEPSESEQQTTDSKEETK